MEHLLAKEGVAGSIPVSRSQKQKRDIRLDISFFAFRVPPALEGSMSSLRSGPRKAAIHWMSCAVSHLKDHIRMDVVLFRYNVRQLQEVVEVYLNAGKVA